MKFSSYLYLWGACYLISSLLQLSPASAQVTPDSTTSTTVNVNGKNFEINGGNEAGNNLFHSFRDFSVPKGGEAFFNNTPNIINIFSRVTGGNISNIDGLIRANGTANLFLINPAGISFGSGASLELGGSFYGSTANSILFEDGEFSATDLDNPPLLTINAPIGLRFRENPAPITVTGNSNTDLQVNPEQNFNLIGGDIDLNTGKISVREGKIELIGLSQAGTIEIDANANFNIPESIERANINLDNFSLQIISTSGNSGDINITARTLSLFNEARLTNLTTTKGNAGNVNINVSDSVLINNNSAIFTNTFAEGDAGNINIKVGNALTLEGANTKGNTGIFSSADFDERIPGNLEGDAGSINIEANNISIANGALINSSTFGSGDGGNINLRANVIALDGDNSSIFSAVGDLESNVESLTGNGGEIDIQAKTISLSDGATVVTQTFGIGSAGTIKINASEVINISGVSSFPFLPNGEEGGFSSGLFSNTENNATGSGGEIIITTPRLQISDGAVINARSKSDASAGNVNVDADVLEITDGSQILTTALNNGAAGNITLNISERILISGIDPNFVTRLNSLIETFGEERAQFTIDPVSQDSGIFTNTTSSSIEGTTGEINITVGELLNLKDGSLISAQASNNAQGGNININAENGFVVAAPSTNFGGDIVANAPQGKGGNITIKAQSVFGLEENVAFDDAVNRLNNGSNDLDASGAVDGVIEIITPDVDALQGITKLREKPVESEQIVTQACDYGEDVDSSNLVVKGKGGIRVEPTAPLSSHELLMGGKTAASSNSNGDRRTSNNYQSTIIVTSTGEKIIPAMGVEITEDGRILLVGYPTSNTQRHPKSQSNCGES
ncbi:MAG: hypothetical protein Tsb0014_12940 [Pleurocapsa sp.]